jgi:hypothetical protein
MLAYYPFQIFLVTRESKYETLEQFANLIEADNLKILKAPLVLDQKCDFRED